MKKLVFLFTGLFTTLATISQTYEPCEACLPEGIEFTTQSQINSFQYNYPNCTEIIGDVEISGIDILNLNGLIVLTSIQGSLYIGNNPALTSLTGLEGLTSIGENLGIGIEIAWYPCNASLTSLTGLDNLTSVGGDLDIIDNEVLTSLTGLDNLASIGGSLNIYYNKSLNSLTALGNVNYIGGGISIVVNNALPSLAGLENVTSIGSRLHIAFNNALNSLTALSNLTYIGGAVSIKGNGSITSLTALSNLTSIESYLYIGGNNTLTDLTGLDNVSSIGWSLSIWENNALTSLTALSNLTSIGHDLYITDNNALTSLSGIDNINPLSIQELKIRDNASLSECEVLSVCDYLVAPNGAAEIYDNANGCNSPEEVQDSCEANAVDIPEQPIADKLYIYPNPANHNLTITIEGFNIEKLSIYTLTGQQIFAIKPKSEFINISSLRSGMYIVEVTVENKKIRQKVVIE